MRLAVISDIHANREALDSVLNSIKGKSVDKIICLGDLVDYGIDFEYCINTVKEHADMTVLGNHDSTVIGRDPVRYMNTEARKSAVWTMERIPPESRVYLEKLQLSYILDDMLFVHSTPGTPEQWHYITNWFDAESQFGNFDEHKCFVGHSHIPGIYVQGIEMRFYEENILKIPDNGKVIVNVGSVGQPRDRDPRACYVIITTPSQRDNKQESIEFVRIEYNVRKTSDKIMASGISDFNANRIFIGL